MADRAVRFVQAFPWCIHVTRCMPAFAVAGVVGVFQIDLQPAVGADPTVWAVTGDVPPAYVAFEENDSWRDALEGYVYEMQAWVDAVAAGTSVDDLIPVNVLPTRDYAEMLNSRLGFIRRNLLEVDPASLSSDV
jgi:hypothetical protein